MEIKINKEICGYTESLILGLSLRQCIFSISAILLSVILYFTLKDAVGRELLSYIIILSAAPFAFMGFFTYHGMNAMEALSAFLKDRLIEPRELVFEGRNLYAQILDDAK